MSECAICQRSIDGTDWACHDCAREHGLDVPFRDWPEWAKECKRFEETRRRQERADREAGVLALEDAEFLADAATAAEALRDSPPIFPPIRRVKNPWPEVERRIDTEWTGCGHPPTRLAGGSLDPMKHPGFLDEAGPGAEGRPEFQPFHKGQTHAGLTPREYAVVVLVWRGYAPREIAEDFGISERSVRRFVQHAREKMADCIARS